MSSIHFTHQKVEEGLCPQNGPTWLQRPGHDHCAGRSWEHGLPLRPTGLRPARAPPTPTPRLPQGVDNVAMHNGGPALEALLTKNEPPGSLLKGFSWRMKRWHGAGSLLRVAT